MFEEVEDDFGDVPAAAFEGSCSMSRTEKPNLEAPAEVDLLGLLARDSHSFDGDFGELRGDRSALCDAEE